ncbi:MAG TPA: iron-sulfur cluster repair di-iron protein [Candidatus Hydrogenedentes bacterium]|nr:iron-sulfur cluster repair di-iron protein [Candidatus Hydrogenedentota bacterium]
MSTINLERTVGELVAERPARSRAFEEFGIDYCCGGKKPLEDACREKGLSPAAVVERLLAAEAASEPDENVDCLGMGLTALIDHIVNTHHAYLRNELPRLVELLAKVAGRHGGKEPRLAEAEEVFHGLKAELEMHMIKEEQVLFPAIREMDATNAPPSFGCGSITAPIVVMEMEHDNAGEALERLRTLTDGYTPPDWACNSYRAVLDGLQSLERDLHQHIHKENNILFPRAVAMEQQVAGGA